MEPVTAATGAADSQTWCFVGAAGGPMVIANNTGARVSCVHTTGYVAVRGGVQDIFDWLMTVVNN